MTMATDIYPDHDWWNHRDYFHTTAELFVYLSPGSSNSYQRVYNEISKWQGLEIFHGIIHDEDRLPLSDIHSLEWHARSIHAAHKLVWFLDTNHRPHYTLSTLIGNVIAERCCLYADKPKVVAVIGEDAHCMRPLLYYYNVTVVRDAAECIAELRKWYEWMRDWR